MTTWHLHGKASYRVAETDDGVTIGAVDTDVIGNSSSVVCMENRTGMAGGPHREYAFQTKFGRIRARIFLDEPVGCLDVPTSMACRWESDLWSEARPELAAWCHGFGVVGTNEAHLARCERRHWPQGVENNGDWQIVNNLGKSLQQGGHVLTQWHAPQRENAQGWANCDTECLRAWSPAPHINANDLEAWLKRAEQVTGCPVVLDLPWENAWTESEIADGLLYIHQRFGARLVGMGRPTLVKAKALERAHNDAQGDLCGLWIVDQTPYLRGTWQSLGAWALAKPGISADLYAKSALNGSSGGGA